MVQTFFWRYQPEGMGEDHLATLEAIYYFYREHWDATHKDDGGLYDGRYDNLLFFYSHMYKIIQARYQEEGAGYMRKKNFVEPQPQPRTARAISPGVSRRPSPTAGVTS